jgi:hypothetical protein
MKALARLFGAGSAPAPLADDRKDPEIILGRIDGELMADSTW